MKFSITTHSISGLNELKALRPPYVRTSLLQEGIISRGNIDAVQHLASSGLNVFPVVTSQRAATITDSQWRAYINRVIPSVPISPSANNRRLLQIGNEWNTQPFYGGPVNADRAYALTKIAVDMFQSKYPCIVILGGITNEFKNSDNKMAARRWIDSFLGNGIDGLIDFWALHH